MQTHDGLRGPDSISMNRHAMKRRDHEFRSKRPKISQACEECRVRKVRCDGVQPVCGTCRGRHRSQRTCTYQGDRGNPGYSANYVAGLEETIRRLTATNGANVPEAEDADGPPSDALQIVASGRAKLHGLVVSPGPSCKNECRTNQEASTSKLEDLGRRGSHRDDALLTPVSSRVQISDIGSSEPLISSMLELEEECDGMGNIGLTETNYGVETSSAASFMETVKQAVAARLSGSTKEAPCLVQTSQGFSTGKADKQMLQSAPDMFVLPPRRMCDEMMEVYWNEVHVLYPLVHQTRFMRSYHNLWANHDDGLVDRSFYCTLNMIFAICCQVTRKESPKEKELSAEVFFSRGREIMHAEILGNGSLALVQALLLMVQFLQGTDWPHRCWIITGLAIRTAQGIGLHLHKTSASMKQQQDREMARRLWHGCVFLDRMVSTTLGRPLMISKTDATAVPFPKSIDDRYLASEEDVVNSQPPETPSLIEFYVQSLKLFEIVEETLSALYHQDPMSDSVHPQASPTEKLENLDFNTILQIDSSIRRWHDALPEYLKVGGATRDDLTGTILRRQANILHLRYEHLRILLSRPILSLLLTTELRAEASSTDKQLCLPQEMALPFARYCISAALSLIDLIYNFQNQNLPNPPAVEALPAWWYLVFYIYTAATALIPARAFSHIRGNVSLDSLAEGWKRSIDVLENLSHVSAAAKRCLAAMQLLNGDITVNESGHAGVSTRGDESLIVTSKRAAPGAGTQLKSPVLSQVLPGTLEPTYSLDETFAAFAAQDFSWLDALPVDLISAEYCELPEYAEY